MNSTTRPDTAHQKAHILIKAELKSRDTERRARSTNSQEHQQIPPAPRSPQLQQDPQMNQYQLNRGSIAAHPRTPSLDRQERQSIPPFPGTKRSWRKTWSVRKTLSRTKRKPASLTQGSKIQSEARKRGEQTERAREGIRRNVVRAWKRPLSTAAAAEGELGGRKEPRRKVTEGGRALDVVTGERIDQPRGSDEREQRRTWRPVGTKAVQRQFAWAGFPIGGWGNDRNAPGRAVFLVLPGPESRGRHGSGGCRPGLGIGRGRGLRARALRG